MRPGAVPLETVVFEYGAHLDRKAHVVFHTNDLSGLIRVMAQLASKILYYLYIKQGQIMFIQTEETPNPNSLKFLPGVDVSPDGPMSCNNQDEAAQSPLASNLFALEYVNSVFLGTDFVTVTKKADIAWEIIKPELLITIMEHFVSGRPTIKSDQVSDLIPEDEDEVSRQIREVINARVRPAVAMDGGDIIFKKFENGIVFLELRGACSGCPSSAYTLKEGVENTLKHYVPEVVSVEAI